MELGKLIGALDIIKDSYQGLTSIYALLNDYKQAYKYQTLFTATKDSIFSSENSKQIAAMSSQYDTEKKEQEIRLLNKEKEKQAAVTEVENK